MKLSIKTIISAVLTLSALSTSVAGAADMGRSNAVKTALPVAQGKVKVCHVFEELSPTVLACYSAKGAETLYRNFQIVELDMGDGSGLEVALVWSTPKAPKAAK